MDSNFIDRLQNISLTAEEGEILEVQGTQREKILEECSLSLLGCFLTTRPYNLRAAKAMLRTTWKLGNDIKIIDVGEGVLQFKFKLESQLQWVQKNGPWSFENHLLVLRRWERGMTARSITFSILPIWMQIWGLSFDLINEEATWDIGKGLGQVIEVDSKTFTSEKARFIRIRVEIPLDKPIRKGGCVGSPEGDRVWVGLKYERLVGLCYQCGIFGHELKDCPTSTEQQETKNPYGEWLRAKYRKSGNISDQRQNRDPRSETRNDEAGAKSHETVDRQNNEDELMREDFQEVNQIHKESITVDYLNGSEVARKEVNSAKAITPMIVAENLVNVQVEYVGVTQPVCNNVPQDQEKKPREITKTQTKHHTENTPTWKRLVRQTNSPMRVITAIPNNSGSKRGQPEGDRDDEEEERKKRKNGDESHEQFCQMVEATERLDRGCATVKWKEIFPTARVTHLQSSSSDHVPILITTHDPNQLNRSRKIPKRFDKKWATNPDCEREKQKQLEALCSLNSADQLPAIKGLKFEINDLLLQEELAWCQRSRSIWLPAGDKNTKFFHQRASHQRHKNQILGIFDDEGNWNTTEGSIAQTAKRYFQHLFTSSNPEEIEGVLNSMDKRVTPSMNASLLQRYTPKEIRKALFQMHPSKSPSPDGMFPFFFQKFWHIVGHDVTTAILSVLNSGHMLRKMNHTHIVLIPKKNDPTHMVDYRPISLANIISRIISKVIANRLKFIFPNVISNAQSAFVLDRLITDNTTVAYELLHRLRTQEEGKEGADGSKTEH
ncbi:uncharacterized protein LOC142616994 [Castanea sativa]|uniref:uncharacterized protein LOC142616994 n=1 Tax=Castanea sativa TaxID=21020 RepID=UPI003F64C402